MALTTVYKNDDQKWSIEEDALGRLWLEVLCGGVGLYSVHYELTPDDVKDFRQSPSNLDALVRRILTRPRNFADSKTEEEYRRQSGGGI